MGKRLGIFGRKRCEATIDLGYERTYQIETPAECGLLIGKAHGIGTRNKQQDSFGISELKMDIIEEKGVLAVLADGMGGLSGGEKASMATVISCLHYFDTHNMKEDVVKHLVSMVQNANMEVKEALGGSSGESGSTLAAALVKDRELFWLSVGDSRIFLYRDGVLEQMSKDHNYAADLRERVEAGELTPEEAFNDPQKNALTSYIGIRQLEKIDYAKKPIALQKEDRILLVSDGIYNSLTTKEIADSMQFSIGKSMMRLGMQIEGKRKKNQDNYTAIVLEVGAD